MTIVVLVFLLYACNDGEVEVFVGCYGNRDGGGVSIVPRWVEMTNLISSYSHHLLKLVICISNSMCCV